MGVYYTAPMHHRQGWQTYRRGRRQFLIDAFALAATAAATGSLADAQARAGGATRRIDVHHHFIPPRHLEAVLSQRESGRTPPWSPEIALAEMDRNGVATSICSLVPADMQAGKLPS